MHSSSKTARLALSCGLSLLLAATAGAQQFDYSRPDRWEAKPQPMKVPAQFRNEAAVILLQEEAVEVVPENKDVFTYATSHNRVKLLTDKGIDQYNKVYIGVGPSTEMVSLKVRTISPQGKVVDLPASAVKEVEEEGRRYKIFAAEGLEKGSELEYKVRLKMPVQFFGTETFQKRSFPIVDGRFSLVTPSYLRYEARPYFGMEVSKDSVIGKERVIVGHTSNVETLNDEPYGQPQKYVRRVEYKLSYNHSQDSTRRLYTWRNLAESVYGRYHTRTAKEDKAIENVLKQINLPANATEEEMITRIEDWVKLQISVNEDLPGDAGEDIESIVKRRQATEVGVAKLLTGLFAAKEIRFQLGFATPRDEMQLDREFENYRRLDKLVFYFPNTGRCLAADDASVRYPLLGYYMGGSEALFLKQTSLGNYATAIPQFRVLPMEPADSHWHNMEIRMELNADLDTALVHVQQIFKGYGAVPYRGVYHFLNQEKQDENTRELISSVGGNGSNLSVTGTKVENAALQLTLSNTPLVVSGDLKAPALVENAGNRLLLKVGDLIGRQTNIYDSSGKPRRLPMELAYPHVLNRTLYLTIPKGYKVQNLGDATMKSEMLDGSTVTGYFRSTARQEGDQVIVRVDERYDRLFYPVSVYPQFMNVINAAADFNKLVLVLAKQ